MAEGNFEAKVSAKRETSSGIFLTLQIQPDDYTADLATLRVGSALMVGWAEVVDTKVDPIDAKFPNGITPQSTPFVEKITKERKPFNSLPLSQQAALRCQDEKFKWFLMDEYPIETAGKHDPAEIVRSVCYANSRAEFDAYEDRANAWRMLESKYQMWLTDKQYADSRR